ncbi:MAG: hypothetical protein RLP09_36630 [Sandaracinaceae bacterium]
MKVPPSSRSSARLAWVSLGVAVALAVSGPSATGDGPAGRATEHASASIGVASWSDAFAAAAPDHGATRAVSSHDDGGHGHLSLTVEKPERDSQDAPLDRDAASSPTASLEAALADRDAVEHRRLRNAVADHDARGPPRG